MLKKVIRVVYWVIVYTLSFTSGYLLGKAAQVFEEKVGLVEK